MSIFTIPKTCPRCGMDRVAGTSPAYAAEYQCGSFILASVIHPDHQLVQEAACVFQERDQLLARLERLEAAGDALAAATIPNGNSHKNWNAAKEAKP